MHMHVSIQQLLVKFTAQTFNDDEYTRKQPKVHENWQYVMLD